MSIEQLKKLAKTAHGMARDIMARGKDVQPFLIFATGDNDHGVVAVVPQCGEPEFKGVIAAALKSKMRKEGATDYVFCFEAWVSGTNDPAAVGRMRPSEDPNRRDTLSIMGSDDAGVTCGWLIDIKTTEGARTIPDLPEPEIRPLVGVMSSLLYDQAVN